MRLVTQSTYYLSPFDESQFAIPWRCDLEMPADPELDGDREFYVVGRILADELRRSELDDERNCSPIEAADADSEGLYRAYSAVFDENNEVRGGEFESIADPFIYLYRFELHPDFADWRMAALDAFCRTFSSSAVIIAQYNRVRFSVAEFSALGFDFEPKDGLRRLNPDDTDDEPMRYFVRDNSLQGEFGFAQYPKHFSFEATKEHEVWIESRGPWKDLI